ncbi:MAG: PilW family protein [Pseudomonadota bacterium]
MKTILRTPSHAQPARKMKMAGFGLVEIMVALVIGLILLGGIGVVFLGAKQTFRTQDDFSRIQENVRYALETIGVDVRMAGYSGCVNLSAIDPNNPAAPIPVGVIANNPPALGLDQALRGYVGGAWTATAAAPANWVANTGVLQITRAADSGVTLTGNLVPTNANVQITGNPYNFVAGEALLVSNCETADLFRATSVSSGGGTVTITHSAAQNSTPAPNTVYEYQNGAEVFRIANTVYFIGTNPAGNPALYRTTFGGATEELVENVEDMVMRFGVDTNNDFIVDSYVDVAGVTDWRQVLTARISLVFRSSNTNVATQDQNSYVVENTTVNLGAADRRLRQVATATFGVRNRLP